MAIQKLRSDRDVSDAEGDVSAALTATLALHGASLVDLPTGKEDPRQILVLPEGLEAHSLKPLMDEYLGRPERHKGTTVLKEEAPFIAHVNTFKTPSSVIFLERSTTAPKLEAVYDYHAPGDDGPRFREFRAAYPFPMSKAWLAWVGAASGNKPLTQTELAEWIEDRIDDLAQPPQEGVEADRALVAIEGQMQATFASPQKMMEIARGFHLRETSDMKDIQRLASGETEYLSSSKHSDDRGQPLIIPSLFLLRIPVFEGGDAYRVVVRLRYKVKTSDDGTRKWVMWTLLLYRPEKMLEDALMDACGRIRDATGIPLWAGSCG